MGKNEFPVSTEHLTYWPYAFDQSAKMQKLLARFTAWKKHVDGVVTFFQGLKSVELQTVKEHQKAAFAWDRQRNSEEGFAAFMDPMHSYVTKMADEHSAFAEFLDTAIIKKLSGLKTEIKKKRKLYKSAFNKSFSSVSVQRNKTLACISQHQKASQKKPIKDGVSYPTDPWLLERVLEHQFASMIKEENSFERRICHVLEDMQVFDRNILAVLTRTWGEFVAEQRKLMNHIESTVTPSLQPLLNFPINDSFSTFLSSNLITTSPVTHHISGFPYTLPDTQLICEGIVYRPGNIVKRNWKPCVMVLTHSGFLHCFRANDKMVKKVLETGGSMNVGRTANSSWGEELQQVYQNLEKPTTEWSVYLRNPRVKVDVTEEPNGNGKGLRNCIIVSVYGVHNGAVGALARRGSLASVASFGSWLSRGRSDSKMLAGSPGEYVIGAAARYTVKVPEEDALVDWVTLIRQKLEESSVEPAPEPLFSSSAGLARKLAKKKDSGVNIDDTHSITSGGSRRKRTQMEQLPTYAEPQYAADMVDDNGDLEIISQFYKQQIPTVDDVSELCEVNLNE